MTNCTNLPPGNGRPSDAPDKREIVSTTGARATRAIRMDRFLPRPIVRPRIHVGTGDLKTISDDVLSVLVERNTRAPFLFCRGGEMVRIESVDGGPPIVRPIILSRMKYVLAREVGWVKQTGGESPKSTLVRQPIDVAADILAMPDPPFPPLKGTVRVPVFGPDGTLQLKPGYDWDSGLYYAPLAGFSLPDVPINPSAGDVERAKEIIFTELLGDFPFRHASDVAHAFALMLLPFCRPLISGPTPLHLITKPSPRTGATLLVDVLLYPVLGEWPARMTEGRDEEEMRRRLTSKLRNLPVELLLDNVRSLHSTQLAAAITAETWEDRPVGSGETIRVPVRCAFVATGNNPILSSEMASRCAEIGLDAQTERPETRTGFRHPNLKRWVKEHHAELVWAVLVLVSAWIAKGKPAGRKLFGGFEEWAEVLGGILDVAGIPGFLENREALYASADRESEINRAFMYAWWTSHAAEKVRVANLYRLAESIDPPMGLGAGTERSQKIRLGRKLGELRNQHFRITVKGEELTVRLVDVGQVHNAQVWQLLKCEPPSGEDGDVG